MFYKKIKISTSAWVRIFIFLGLSAVIGGMLASQLKLKETSITVTLCGGSPQPFDYFSADYTYSQRVSYPGGNMPTSIRFKPSTAKPGMGHRFDFGGKSGEMFLISSIILEKPGYKRYVLDLDRAEEWIKTANQIKTPKMLNHQLLIETTGNDGYLVTTDQLFESFAKPQFNISWKKIFAAAVAELILLLLLLAYPLIVQGIICIVKMITVKEFLITSAVFMLINLILILPAAYFYCRNLPDVFSITLKAKQSFPLEIFYKTPYSQQASRSETYSDSEKYQTLNIQLPNDAERNRIRIDFGSSIQTISVKSISIIRYGLFRCSVDLKHANQVYPIRNHIGFFQTRNRLLKISICERDPYIVPDKNSFASNLHCSFDFLIPVCLELFVLFFCFFLCHFWNRNSWDIKRNMINSLLTAFTVIIFIHVTIPCQTLISNQELFQCSVKELLYAILPSALLEFFILGTCLFVLQKVLFYIPHLILLSLIAYEYLETGVLSIGLPQLNGDISTYGDTARCIWDTTILIVITICPLLFYRFLKKYLHWFALCILILTTASGFDGKGSSQNSSNSNKKIVPSMDRINVVNNVSYSPSNNVMVFILDSVTAEVLQDVFTNHKDIAALYPGFVNYVNNVGMHVQTLVGVPGIMTGKYFENPVELVSYSTSSFGPDSFIKPYLDSNIPVYINLGLTQDSGYTNATAADSVQKGKKRENTYPLKRRAYGMLLWSLEELTCFRMTPYILKKPVLAYIMEHWPRTFSQNITNDKNLFKLLASKKIDPTKKAVLNVHHSNGSHPPFIFKANGEPRIQSDISYSPYYEQTVYIAKLLGNLFARYREMGIYDSATIIVLADHGINVRKNAKEKAKINFAAFPCLMVKPANEKGTLRSSDLPTSHSKVAKLVKILKNRILTQKEIEKILYTEKRLYREGQNDLLNDWLIDQYGKITHSQQRVKVKKQKDLQPLQAGKKYLFRIFDNPDYPDFICEHMSRTSGRGLDIYNNLSNLTIRVEKPDTQYNLTFEIYFFAASNQVFSGRFFFGSHGYYFKPWTTTTISFTSKSDKNGFISLKIDGREANYFLCILSLIVKPI